MASTTFPSDVLEVIQVDGDCQLTLRVLAGRESGSASPTALVLPAMGTPARFYAPFSAALRDAGLTVVTTDLRGQGECVPRVTRESRFGYREMVEDDLSAVLAAVRRARPDAPLYLVGHSLGGHLALLHAAQRAPDVGGGGIAGIVAVASGSVWYRAHGPVRGLGVLAGTQVAVGVARAVGYWPGGRIGFGGRQPTGVIRDWARQARTGRFSFAGSTPELERRLRALDLPLLAISVGGDEYAPPSAVDHLCAIAASTQVTRWHYSASEAGGRPLDHFQWVRASEPVAARIAAWLPTA